MSVISNHSGGSAARGALVHPHPLFSRRSSPSRRIARKPSPQTVGRRASDREREKDPLPPPHSAQLERRGREREREICSFAECAAPPDWNLIAACAVRLEFARDCRARILLYIRIYMRGSACEPFSLGSSKLKGAISERKEYVCVCVCVYRVGGFYESMRRE